MLHQNFLYDTPVTTTQPMITTGAANYRSFTSSANTPPHQIITYLDKSSDSQKQLLSADFNTGKYCITDIANWFLSKEPMTHKKLQKLCYYSQAWFYALKNCRLASTDFQAWVHGPVSPVLYEKFKTFGYSTIQLSNAIGSNISSEDQEFLEDIWETYGSYTGNALEALSHTELPWKEARRGYDPNERCTVAISPDSMKNYYRSIYNK